MRLLAIMLPVCIAITFACSKRNESSAPINASDGDDDGHCQLVKEAVEPTKGYTPQVDVVAEGLEVPWGIAFLPGGDMLVTERAGRLRRIRGGRLEVIQGPDGALYITTSNCDGRGACPPEKDRVLRLSG